MTASDVDGDLLTYRVVSGPAHGVLTGTAPDLTYVPAAGYTGPDTFTFVANDGLVDSPVATVTVEVTHVNHAPVAAAQSVSTPRDTALPVVLTGSDVDGDALSFAIVSGPAHGSLTGTGASRTYTPQANYAGPDSFSFKTNDGLVDSAPAAVSITVASVNDAPVADAQSVTTNEDTAKAIALSASDANGDPLTFSIVSGPSHGALTGTGAARTYTPDANFSGPDSFVFTVNDGTLDSNTATVSITVSPLNDPPVAVSQSVETPEDAAKAITLQGSDIDGDTRSFTVTSGPSHGVLTGSGANRTYTPQANYAGPDSFTFVVNDTSVDSNVATVSITVTPVNDTPVANNQSTSTPESVAKSVALTGSDLDGDALTFTVTAPPAHGTLTGTGASLTYTPVAGYHGPDSFAFTVNDGVATSAAATVSITVTPVVVECSVPAPHVDVEVSADQRTPASQIKSPKLTTSQNGELLLALISTDGPTSPTQRVTKVTGGGLTWTLASRANQTWGTTEIWQARATNRLSKVVITADLAKSGFDGAITVVAFTGAADRVASTGAASGVTGAASVTLDPGSCNSLIWATGHNWSRATNPIPALGQSIVHKFIDTRVGDSYWTQRVDVPTLDGSPVVVKASGSVKDRWTMVAVEVPGA